MNIDVTTKVTTTVTGTSTTKVQNDGLTNFADELTNLATDLGVNEEKNVEINDFKQTDIIPDKTETIGVEIEPVEVLVSQTTLELEEVLNKQAVPVSEEINITDSEISQEPDIDTESTKVIDATDLKINIKPDENSEELEASNNDIENVIGGLQGIVAEINNKLNVEEEISLPKETPLQVETPRTELSQTEILEVVDTEPDDESSQNINRSDETLDFDIKKPEKSADKKTKEVKLQPEEENIEEVQEEDNFVVKEEPKQENPFKKIITNTDKKETKEDNALINNDMNIQEQNEALMLQMGANMSFNSNGQPFAELMNNQDNNKLNSSKKDLAEEQAILSTMDENIAMANKNRVLAENNDNIPRVKTVVNTQGVKKVDTKTNVTVETVVKYDSIVMNENDVDFFVQLVENGQVEASQVTAQSSKVSKTLADLIAKAMKDSQPVRIDFDNNISVIIKIGKDGKISADFLPSSQVAEAYLKENLPILRQKFESNNIEYDELNHRQRKQDDKDNQKKGRKDE